METNVSRHPSCKFEVLMSCMHQTNFDLAYKSKIASDLLIINQCDRDGYDEITVDGHTWRMISTTDRGSANSRNLALKNARGEICLLADDDEVFECGYEENILKAYEIKPTADAIAFDVNRIGKTRRSKYYRPKKFRRIPRGRGFPSYCISFNMEKAISKGIRFNEKFGSGAPWGGGEDTLFVKSIRESGMKMYENPLVIATVNYEDSQWFSGYDERYYFNNGAFWREYYGRNIIMREIRFFVYAIMKNSQSKLGFFKKMRMFHTGAKCIKKGITYSEWKNENSVADK